MPKLRMSFANLRIISVITFITKPIVSILPLEILTASDICSMQATLIGNLFLRKDQALRGIFLSFSKNFYYIHNAFLFYLIWYAYIF